MDSIAAFQAVDQSSIPGWYINFFECFTKLILCWWNTNTPILWNSPFVNFHIPLRDRIKMTWPGFEPGLLQPPRKVLTTRGSWPVVFNCQHDPQIQQKSLISYSEERVSYKKTLNKGAQGIVMYNYRLNDWKVPLVYRLSWSSESAKICNEMYCTVLYSTIMKCTVLYCAQL